MEIIYIQTSKIWCWNSPKTLERPAVIVSLNFTTFDTVTFDPSDGVSFDLNRKLYIAVDKDDDNYMPGHIIVMGGPQENLKKLNDVHIDL